MHGCIPATHSSQYDREWFEEFRRLVPRSQSCCAGRNATDAFSPFDQRIDDALQQQFRHSPV
jgi:hypothetical protein